MLTSSVMLDLIIAVIVVFSAWLGAKHGLFRTLAELAAYVVAYVASVILSGRLAGLAVEFWSGREEIRSLRQTDRLYRPNMDPETRTRLLKGWHKAVGRSLNWAEPEP